MMPWWVCSLVANATIIATEYLNRTATGGWLSVLPATAPLIFVAQWCLFQAFNGASHWLWAWAFFTIGNSIMRVVAVYALAGQDVANWFYVGGGISVMLLGAFLLKEGLS